jgi:hypothetical protein
MGRRDMTPELQQYYENRLEMTSTQAWKDLMEDVEGMLAVSNTLDGVTEDNLQFRKGEISLMRWLLNLRQISDTAYQQLKEDDEAAKGLSL